MKKLWLLGMLAGTLAAGTSALADIQNIMLSGDIRLRGYYLNRADEFNHTDSAFISQRTRVSIESTLDDRVLVVVTLSGESLWGSADQPANNAGAGTPLSSDGSSRLNRRFDIGVSEAFVQLNQMFDTPATLKIGRQYLHYGRGLILSAVDEEYNHDAVRMVMDFYPLTLDAVYVRTSELNLFGNSINRNLISGHATDMIFLNAHRDFADSPIKNVEAYFAYLIHGEVVGAPHVPPSDPYATFPGKAAAPWLVGARAELALSEGWDGWAEFAYEGGANGDSVDFFGNPVGGNISAFIINTGTRLSWKDARFAPALNLGYTYASGGGENGSSAFRPWFDYMEGYNGYLFAPLLSNIHIFNLGGSAKLCANTTFAIQGYYYLKADSDTAAWSNMNIDFGGLGFIPTPAKRELGWEIDSILGYDYSKDVRLQLVYGVFLPGRECSASDTSATAHEVRAELNVHF